MDSLSECCFHTHEALGCSGSAETCLWGYPCVSPLQSSPVLPAVVESDGIWTTKSPKCQDRTWVKALRSLSTQRMNSRGNLGARGNALALGTISICWMASMSSGYSNRCFVGAFMEEERILVDRAAAASCKGKFCPVPWHHRHGLLCEVHPI